MELVLLFHLRTLRWCVKDLPVRRYPVSALYGNLEPAATPAQVNDLLARAIFCPILMIPFFTPCVGCMQIQDSLWFWIPRLGFRIPGTGSQSLSTELNSNRYGIRTPWAVFQIPKPRVPDSTSKNFPDSLTWGDVFLQCLSSRSF